MTAKPAAWIGASVERLEDWPLVTGQGCYAGDIAFPHQLHMRIVRSPHAHGRLKAIDTTEARALRGVVAIWTADDIADLPPIDFREAPNEKLAPFRQPVLAQGVVRYRSCAALPSSRVRPDSWPPEGRGRSAGRRLSH